MPQVIGIFQPQAWIRDYAEDIDGRETFDCTEKIVKMGREAALAIEDNRDESFDLIPRDILKRHENMPYRVEVEDAIEAYFDELDTQAALGPLKSNYCTVPYDNGTDLTDTLLISTTSLTRDEWSACIQRASELFDPIHEHTPVEGVGPALRAKLEAAIANGHGTIGFLEHLYPQYGITTQEIHRVHWS
jgi:hypothetical protein